jgi:hypothetical protein
MAPPPGYVSYGGPGSAMPQVFRRVKGLAKAIDVLLIINVPLQAIGIVGLLQIQRKARDFLDGEISRSDFADSTRVNLNSLAGLLVLPIAVLTIIIMYRMAQNLRGLGRPGASWAPGWAIGGWFCPPCAIYAIPWLMFRELWRGSDPGIAPNDLTWKQRPVSPLVNVWWVLYGLVPLVGFATAAGFVSNIRTIDEEQVAQRFADFAVVNIALSVVGIVTTVVYLLMMRQLASRHMQATREQ